MNIIQTLVVDNSKEKPPKTILAVKFFQLKAPFRIECCCQPAGALPHFLQQLPADGQIFPDPSLTLQLEVSRSLALPLPILVKLLPPAASLAISGVSSPVKIWRQPAPIV